MSDIDKPGGSEGEGCPGGNGRVDRRHFLRLVGGGATVLAVGGAAPRLRAAQPAPVPAARPAEALVQEFFAGLTAEQRRHLVLPWDHGAEGGQTPTRLRLTDRAINRRIGDTLSRAQQELVERILRALCAGEDGYRQLSRNGTFDDPNGILSVGANFFGDPAGKDPYTCVFTGHHLTVRCDGNSEHAAAFGGPMYFGHVVHGYSKRNCYAHHTRAALEVFDALSEKQRRAAVVRGTPGDHQAAVQFRPDSQARPGLSTTDLTSDQIQLVEQVMRTVLSPFRPEDADEVMKFVRGNGGLEKISLAFYEEGRAGGDERWHSWRLEGPGFVWSLRVLPHVHCYVNVVKKPV
jgi:hypothetical protein